MLVKTYYVIKRLKILNLVEAKSAYKFKTICIRYVDKFVEFLTIFSVPPAFGRAGL